MKATLTAVGLALAIGVSAAPAVAAQAKPAAAPATGERKINISKPAGKAVLELKTAVDAKDLASVPAKLAAAQAASTTPDDRYYVGLLQLKAAVAAKDNAQIAAALEAMLASGLVQQAELASTYMDLGKTYSNLNQNDKAAVALDRALQLNANDVDAAILLGEIRAKEGKTAEAVKLISQAIAIRTAAGQKPDERWYKRAVSLAYNAKLPIAVPASREWLKAYPTMTTWRDSLRIYRSTYNPDEATQLDMYRLQRAAKALQGEADYYQYAQIASRRGLVGEADAVLDAGIAASQFSASSDAFKPLIASINGKLAGDKAGLAASETRARAGATATSAVGTADAYYGHGDYAKAAELYRLALTKSGGDANLINMRLGSALAMSGDKAGATAAFTAVTGPRAELAKYWLLFLAQQA